MTARVSNMIGDILLRENKISKEDLERGLELQSDSHGNLGDILIKENIVSEEALTEALGIQTKIPYLDLEDFIIDIETLKILKADDARKFKTMPLFIIDETLTVAISDPSDVLTIERLVSMALDLRENFPFHDNLPDERFNSAICHGVCHDTKQGDADASSEPNG